MACIYVAELSLFKPVVQPAPRGSTIHGTSGGKWDHFPLSPADVLGRGGKAMISNWRTPSFLTRLTQTIGSS